jgi:predicted DNA-binding transcriptional regulator AlpA
MNEKRIMAAAVCELCGGISIMTLWRWAKQPGFPQPIYIGRRRYWRESEIVDWLNSHADAACPAGRRPRHHPTPRIRTQVMQLTVEMEKRRAEEAAPVPSAQPGSLMGRALRLVDRPKRAELMTLLVLAQRCRHRSTHIEMVAAKAGICRRTAMGHVRSLIAAGLVRQVGRGTYAIDIAAVKARPVARRGQGMRPRVTMPENAAA